MKLPFKAKDYVEEFYPNQELFSVSDMKRAYADGAKVASSKNLHCWIPVSQPPMAKANRGVFIMSVSPVTGVEIVKVYSSEFKEYMEFHEGLYWCYEDRIVPKRIRAELRGQEE